MRRRSLASAAMVCGAIVIATAGGDPAAAPGEAWDSLRLLWFVPAWAVVGWLPGWWMLERTRGLATAEKIACSILLSLVLAFGLGAIALVFGVPLTWVARALAVLAIVGAIWSWRSRFEPATAPRARVLAAALIATWALSIAVAYGTNAHLRSRVDGWFHAAVAARVAQVGVPPDDPWYAGERLRYGWAPHVVLDVATAAAPGGATPLDAMAGWSVLAAIVTGCAVVAAGARWAVATGNDRHAAAAGAWALGFAVLGLGPQGFAAAAARAAAGHDRGLGELSRPLTEGAGATLQSLAWGLPHASLAFFGDKFLTPTAFGLALGAVVLALAALLLGTRSRAQLCVGGVATLAALVFHPFTGCVLVLALVIAAIVEVLRARDAHAALAVLVPVVAAGLIAAPYLLSFLAPRSASSAPRFGDVAGMAVALIATGWLVLAFASGEAVRALRSGASGAGAIVVVALVCLIGAVGIGLAQRNETKLLNLGLLVLAVPAGAAAARHARAGALALWFAFPTSAYAYAGFALDAGQEALGRREVPRDLADGYAWIRTHTEVRDVLLEPQRADARDPVRDLLVTGPRPLVWGGDSYAGNWGYAESEMALRRTAARELADGALSASTTDALARRFVAQGRALYALERVAGKDGAPRALAKPGRWERVFAGPHFAIDRLDAPPSNVAEATR